MSFEIKYVIKYVFFISHSFLIEAVLFINQWKA